MKFSTTLSALAAAGVAAAAKLEFEASMLENNKMQNLMELKTSAREAKRENGDFAANKYKSMKPTACANGSAGQYSCENVDLQASLTHGAMGSQTREGNDIWGTSTSLPM